MDPLMALFCMLLAASGTTFLWLSWFEGRRVVAGQVRSGSTIALDDLVGASHPLAPRTIRQTPLD
jgi:hypothetical protein